MATDIAKAYVQIIPSADGISGALGKTLGVESGAAGISAGESMGKSLVSTLVKVVAAAGIGKMLSDVMSEGGALQQSFGGLETIYGDAAEAAKEYSKEAQAAGISMNDYAEQAVSFGAALKQAYEGDTAKAVEAANTAILDMADNAAKMGTPLESIQNAYQGFAKQNYTMLDNLKLGYGGTKKEMERLLADATRLSGVEYNIENLGDVYDAIHVIQQDLGLTGVAAYEAEETFTGSMGAMRAAADNLKAALATGMDITPALETLTGNAMVFLEKNMLPMFGKVLEGLPTVLQTAFSFAIGSLNKIAYNAESIVQFGVGIVTELVGGILSMIPYLVEAALNLVVAFGKAIITTDWASVASDFVGTLRDDIDLSAGEIFGVDDAAGIVPAIISGIEGALPGLINSGVGVLTNVIQGITEKLPDIYKKGNEILINVVNGILERIPGLITTAGEIVTKLAGFILQNLPTLLSAGADLLKELASGFVKNIPAIVKAGAEALAKLLAKIAEYLPTILKTGIELLGKLAAGLIQAIPDLVRKIPQIIKSIVTEFKNHDWRGLGGDIINGIATGISNAGSAVMNAALNAAKGALDTVKRFFGISSPSKLMRDEVGKQLMAGAAIGVEKSSGLFDDALNDALSIDGLNLSGQVSGYAPNRQATGSVVINVYGAEGQDVNALANIIMQKLTNQTQAIGAAFGS